MHVSMATERAVVPARGSRVNMAAILKHISSSNTLAQVFVPITLLLLTVMPFQMVYGIDCFKCVSMNGANKACDDPFHNNYSAAILESPCMGGRKGRDGLFPATSCIKIAGYYGEYYGVCYCWLGFSFIVILIFSTIEFHRHNVVWALLWAVVCCNGDDASCECGRVDVTK
uniref:Protein sleepless n=1 Tax=Anopheles culicifacies TaxID=139723 RepID=A0A182M2B2_9DIPT